MKKTIILIIGILILLIWWYNLLDSYLCSHLYYGWGPFSSCSWWQGKWIDMVWNSANRGILMWGILSALVPVLYLMIAKKISLRNMMATFFCWAALYVVGALIIKDSLFGQGFLILIFNIAVLFVLLYWFLAAMIVFGNTIFNLVKWNIWGSIHEIFLKFTLWLIVFCFINVLLLQFHLFYWIIIILEIILLTYLMSKKKQDLKEVAVNIEEFIDNTRTTFSFSKNKFLSIFFIGVVLMAVWYTYVWFNLAYIPYPTAWDANHAYIFFPRIRAINNWLYRWTDGTAWSVPFLWYGFLTFWFKFAQTMPWNSWLFGISPDSLTVLMNFWSGPFIFIASGFTIHAVLKMLTASNQESQLDSNAIMMCILLWLLLVILWLTSWMGAFLIFVDNKTDLAVLFFTIIAIYTWIQFLLALKHEQWNKYIKHYAILSWFFFAASILAKPTGMFDVMHFAILFFLQWNWVVLAIWWYLAILWWLWLTKLLLVSQFITTSQSYLLLLIWWILALIWFIPTIRKKFRLSYLRHFFIWIFTIIFILILYKWPFALIQQLKTDWKINIPNIIRIILLADRNTPSQKILLASNVSLATLSWETASISWDIQTWNITTQATEPTNVLSKSQCIGSLEWKNLYENLRTAGTDWLSEDQWRYIWYGQKTFKSIWMLSRVPDGCYSIYGDARWLCMKIDDINNWTKESVVTLLEQQPVVNDSPIIGLLDRLKKSSDTFQETRIKRDIVTYVQSNTFIVWAKGISIPYKFLVPFNVTANWSLQNLSSYYTDIWIIWLLWFFIALLWVLYWTITRNKQLTQFSVITLWSWAMWWVVWSAILWYSLWLIVWTILWVVVFVYNILHKHNKKDEFQTILIYSFIGLLLCWACIQLTLNLLRISSQWSWWPFSWYKSNVWEKYIFNDQLLADKSVKIWFNANDVLDLQFPHYKWVITKLNTRGDDEWIVIAWTYLQYFINDQSTIQSDWFLSLFWENISDNNVCNSYLRLKDQKKKYIVIDPNIASVVMWDWNKSLFDRFYAVVTADWKLQQHGTLTMLQALSQQWYMKLFGTNNLITKYAFILPDEQLSIGLGITDKEKLLLERAKMSAARFFPNGDAYGNIALQAFANRMNTYEAIWDISDVIWKPIREDVVIWIAQYVDAWVKPEKYSDLQKKIQELTQDEKIVLQQYFAFKKSQKENPQQFRQYVVSLVSQSINNWSQLIVLTVE